MKLRVPYLLVALSLVPILGGIVRLSHVSAGTMGAAGDERFLTNPVPVVIHIVCAAVYSIVGAFQFDDRLRRSWPKWHRRAGWGLAVCGFLVAVTGVWMTLAYVIPVALQGELVFFVRLVVGVLMALSVVLAITHAVKRNFRAHRAWMVRAYALGQGAGTQALLFLPPTLVLGREILGTPRDLLLTLAWILNAIVAELILARKTPALGGAVPAA